LETKNELLGIVRKCEPMQKYTWGKRGRLNHERETNLCLSF